MPKTFSPQPVLIILHQEQSSPGRIGFMLTQKGYQLDMRRPCLGEPLPRTMEHHSGAIIFGGPMSANNPDAYIKQEIDWISIPLREQKPYLGVCLGAQMLARQLGEKVAPHADGRAEIGYYSISPTPAGDHLCASPLPQKVYQWHREGFDLPKGARLLAAGEHFPHQAFSYGPAAFGVQFHPEVTLATMHRWCVRAAERMGGLGAQQPAQHFAGWYQHDRATALWLSDFLDHWLKSGQCANLAHKTPAKTLA
jgi:GMP synthase (glutamine-hydrolysing)